MREIKFRGKRVDNGEWVYGSFLGGRLCHIMSYKTVKKTESTTMFAGYEVLPVIPETVGQYTGRKDKLGKEVWEGNIVREDREDSFPQYNTGEIVYDDNRGRYLICYFKKIPKNSFLRKLRRDGDVITDTTGNYLYGEYGHWPAKVIGDVHDNSELNNPKLEE